MHARQANAVADNQRFAFGFAVGIERSDRRACA